MSRTIGASLQAHLDTQQTTLCWLLKITPEHESAFGITSLNIDVPYDDGGGSLTYQSSIGMNLSATEAHAGLEVANAEALVLVSGDLTKAKIEAGVFDYGSYNLYRINYKDTSMGHYMPVSGTVGIVRSDNPLVGVLELRGLTQALKQNFNDLYSKSCRAVFGSQVSEEPFPCLFDATTLESAGTILTVGSEADRQFTATSAPTATGPNGAVPFDFAVITFNTGPNAGLIVETETVTGAVIELRFSSPFDMTAGDTYTIRPDCAKRYEDDCIDLFDNGEIFRGEPWLSVSEEVPLQVPGANIPGVGRQFRTP